MSGSNLLCFGPVLITVTESSLCSYGTVIRIRDVLMPCVILRALCARYTLRASRLLCVRAYCVRVAYCAHYTRGKGMVLTYPLGMVPARHPGSPPILSSFVSYLALGSTLQLVQS